MAQAIKQTITFDAAPVNALCWGGYINGHTLELIKDKEIVQAWRGKDWPPGEWSLVNFKLEKLKGGKTRLKFSHVGLPAAKVKHLAAGWRSHYWTPLKAALKAAKVPAPKTKAAKTTAAKSARPARSKARASSPARARRR
ncbi:MAG: SRPBCC domain-containing protein [Rhodospirillales bacterium]|jgi:activator of HSP90 ATPase|nr:SRPBCC domain-containing protein [Rhodospirillales bacterium]